VEDSELTQTISRCWLIQAVARALKPGTKGDVCLILVGPQGAKKSSLLREVAGEAYFADTPLDIGSRNAYIQLQRAWIYEVAELDSIRRSHNSSTKAFLSATEDTFVPPYGRHAVSIKRHVCFCGSTNEDTFLRDKTGSRRFWPVKVGNIDLTWAKQNREQLWAEAVHLYKSGAQWWLGRNNEDDLAEESTQYEESDPWLSIIAEFLMGRGGSALDAADIMREALKLDSQHMSRTNSGRLHEVMAKLGWVRERRTYGGARGYYWVKKTEILKFNKLSDL
jgi:predicted P-loop ATPase